MYKLSIQTKGILDMDSPHESVRDIKAAGFSAVDFNLDDFLQNFEIYDDELNAFFDQSDQELKEYFKDLKEAFSEYDIEPHQMHAPYPVMVPRDGMDHINDYMAQKVIPKSFQVANYLGVSYMVVHPIKLQYIYSKEREYQDNLQFFLTLADMGKDAGVIICLENLYILKNYSFIASCNSMVII